MKSFKAREKARRYAMQALYSWVISHSNIHDIEAFYLSDRNPKKFDVPYFHKILYAISSNQIQIDKKITCYIDKTLHNISIIDLNILRIATYEMMYSIDIPFKVIISQAILLAKNFSANNSHKFINSVLDKMAKILRASEHMSKEKSACIKKNTTQKLYTS